MAQPVDPPPPALTGVPYAQQLPLDDLRRLTDQQVGGNGNVRRNDPAFQPPSDPLASRGPDPTVVYRDIPIVSIVDGTAPGVGWDPPGVLAALQSHVAAVFDSSGQLYDAILADDRVQATFASRLAALFGRETRIRPANDSRAAKEVADAWADHWPEFQIGSSLPAMHMQQIGAGIAPGQLNWDTRGSIWKPYLVPWHFRYTYYHWNARRYVAITLDGQKAIYPGDGKWVLHAPRGEYRGWMYGALRAIAYPWLLRSYAIRDMARYSERHGMPIIKCKVPAAADQSQRDRFQAAMSALGVETTAMLPQGVDGINSFDLELLEATSSNWEVHPGLIDRCDMSIILAIQMQNLTTEVKGGSYAAASSHMDVRQNGTENDNNGWKYTLRNQVARPFAMFNFGDADLAPWTDWDVTPREDLAGNAQRFYSFGQSIQILRQGGIQFTDEGDLRTFAKEQFGIRLPKSVKLGEPDNGSGTSAASPEQQAARKTLQGSKGSDK